MNIFSVNTNILNVRSAPEVTPGNKIGGLVFGQQVTVLSTKDGWSEIQYLDGKAWVSSIYLTPVDPSSQIGQPISAPTDIADEFPQFIVGIPNLASDLNTCKLRKIIGDVFGDGAIKADLQCTEYVQYRIVRNGVTIRWPADRPRHGGRWADIFERNNLYKVLSNPVPHCAISFTTGLPGVTGHVAYVEEVFPDGSIRITEANWPGQGRYNDRRVPQSVWKDRYKCRFTDFS